jgi:hypothetical protein
MPKSTIELALCESSSNIIGYGYDTTTSTLAIKFKAGPGGKTYHYAGVPPILYAEFLAAESKGKFLAQSIKTALNGNGEPLYPATLMEPEQPDDDEGDDPVPQPKPSPTPPIGDPEKEAA